MCIYMDWVELKNKGNKLVEQGKFTEAENVYSEGLEIEPSNAVLLLNRAVARIKLQKWNEALADCEICLEIDKENAKAFARKARALLGLGMVEEARVSYEKAEQLNPELKELENWRAKTENVQKAEVSSLQKGNERKEETTEAEIQSHLKPNPFFQGSTENELSRFVTGNQVTFSLYL